MSAQSPEKKRALGVVLAGAFVVATTAAIVATSAATANAIPPSQSICAPGAVTFTSASGWIDLAPARTIVITGSTTTTLKLEAAADVGVGAGAEVRLAWAYNSGGPVEGIRGPANFAGPTSTWESRSTFGLITNVGAGTSTVRPMVRLSAPNTGISATMLNRCFTLEAFTS